MLEKMNILKVFFEEPTKEFNVREIAKILDISPATASKILKWFYKRGFLTERSQKVFIFYKANAESEAYRDLKVYYNTRKIRESGLIEALNRFYLKPTIVLFGSGSEGMDTETSDLDILVVSEREDTFPDLKKFEKKLNRGLQLFPVKGLKYLRNEHLINNVINGITIQGRLKWM
jgi:predicted nucleotidyltransferase